MRQHMLIPEKMLEAPAGVKRWLVATTPGSVTARNGFCEGCRSAVP
ncbi:hypothetical protein [Acidicapsa ligni]|nr:hypothetical protein [Acidicapsa ligni]